LYLLAATSLGHSHVNLHTHVTLQTSDELPKMHRREYECAAVRGSNTLCSNTRKCLSFTLKKVQLYYKRRCAASFICCGTPRRPTRRRSEVNRLFVKEFRAHLPFACLTRIPRGASVYHGKGRAHRPRLAPSSSSSDCSRPRAWDRTAECRV
jgi:hypothetical protein